MPVNLAARLNGTWPPKHGIDMVVVYWHVFKRWINSHVYCSTYLTGKDRREEEHEDNGAFSVLHDKLNASMRYFVGGSYIWRIEVGRSGLFILHKRFIL